MAPEYIKAFANVYEAVGNLTLARELLDRGDIKNGSDRVDQAFRYLQKVAKDFPAEYEAAIMAHPSRRQWG